MGSSTSNVLGPVIASAAPPPAPPPPESPVPPSTSPPYIPPTYGGNPLGGCGLPGRRFQQSYVWNFIVTNLHGETITMLTRLASNRSITRTLNDALTLSFDVPSDNKRVNIPYTDGDPKLDEGTRLVYAFRHETTGTWTCRASTIVLQVHDVGDVNVSRTEVNCWDAWKYLDFLPVYNVHNIPNTGPMYERTGHALDSLSTQVDAVQDMIRNQLELALFNYNDLMIDFGQTAFYTGNIDSGFQIPLPHPFSSQNGDSVGQFLRDIAARGWCDIVLEPIYDPVNRPGMLCQLSVYPGVGFGGDGYGRQNHTAIFSWDRMPRTLTGIDRVSDGTQRSNAVQFYHSRGGPPIALKTDLTSQAKYRRYYQSKYFVTQGGQVEAIEDLALAQILLRANGIETITIDPTPERSKVPFLDYDIGDVVPIYSSNNMRKQVFDTYRVLQIPIQISDNSLETVQTLTLKKVITPDPVAPPLQATIAAVGASGGAAIQQALRSTLSSLPGP